MGEKQDIRKDIDYRLYNLLMRLDKGQEAAGVEVEGKVKAEQSEQFNARRELLEIEVLAKRDMELNKRSQMNYLESVSKIVHDEVYKRIQDNMEDMDKLCDQVLQIDPEIAQVLELLSVRAVSIAKLEPLINAIPWMAADILKLVNSPKHRKKDRLGKVIKVENLRMALSFIGIDNLKILIPSMAFKRWIPKVTDPYPGFKHKIWEHTLATALSSQRIAQIAEVNENQAYVLGMFHDVGKLAIAKMYFKFYEAVHREALMEAHKEQKRDEHEALTKIGPSTDFWFSLMWNYSLTLSKKVIEHLNMKRLFIASAMDEFAQNTPFDDMSPLARVLVQGNAYAKYRVLKSYKLINMDEAKEYLKSFKMPAGALGSLKTLDVRVLPLSFEEE